MFWKILLSCDPQYAEKLAAALEDHVLSVSWFETKDPLVWRIEAVTKETPDEEKFARILKVVSEELGIANPPLTFSELPERDWLEDTWRNFPPLQIGRYYIYGSHTTPTPPADSVTIEINAATAFGSGEHETTTGCLLTLDNLAKQGRIFRKPLDMGCGSGILAIATAKTWNIPVVAVDNDPESVRVTANNAILNQCPDLITTYCSEGFSHPDVHAAAPFDLIVANILATPLMEMAEPLSKCLAPHGLVILSGLLTRHRQDILHAYAAHGIRLVSNRTMNDWEALLLIKEG
jgi:ribosomal protein L11 methyltransferase